MGRMYSFGKGMSRSTVPYRRSIPNWLKISSEEVIDMIIKMARKGKRPSEIGVFLRDWHGVGNVSWLTGNKILRIMRAKGLAPAIPEDLYNLIKKAVATRKNLERNRRDKHGKYRLVMIESRIHRLARWYKTKRVLPPTFKYESANAYALIS